MKRPSRSFAIRIAMASAGALSLLVIACSSNNPPPGAGLAEGCLLNTDCASPLVCAFRRCHNACTTTRDCPAPERCVASDRPFDVCQLDQERQCAYNSQCPAGEICAVDGQCRDECTADRDCVPGQSCVSGSCAEPTELNAMGTLSPAGDASTQGVPCAYNTDCPSPLVCRNGGCSKECIGDRDCPVGEVCVSSRCQVPAHDAGVPETGGMPDGSSMSDGSPGGDASSMPDGGASSDASADAADAGALGATCSLPSDCPSPLVCTFGHCSYQCNATIDCPVTQCCVSHRCLSGSVCSQDGGTTGGGSDAAIDAPACSDDSQCAGVYPVCAGISLCVGGVCAPPRESLCDDHNPCTQDACDGDAGTCTHTPIGPQDVDHDGHFSAACPGGDDCDDNNPDVYPGHPEMCDGVDNNCDGRIDEGVWSWGAPTQINSGDAGAGTYGVSGGTPTVVALSDGSLAVLAPETPGLGSLDGWKLSSSLSVTSGPVAIDAVTTGAAACGSQPAKNVIFPSAATDGTTLGVGGYQSSGTSCGCCGGSPNCGAYNIGSFALTASGSLGGTTQTVLGSQSSSCGGIGYSVTPVNVAYNAGTGVYDLAWADLHIANISYVYVAEMTPAGVVGGAKQVLPTLSGESNDANFLAFPQIGAGPNSVLVAWKINAASGVRYALLDPHLAAILAGPFDLTENGDIIPTSIAYSGGSFALVAQSPDGTVVRMHRIDPTTGTQPVPSYGFPTNSAGASNVRLAPVRGGFGLTLSRGNVVTFGWMPASFQGGLTTVDSPTGAGAAVTSGGLAPIDAKHVAVAWQDGNVKAAILTCGP